MEPESLELRYVLGELMGPIEIDPGTAAGKIGGAPGRTDRIPKIESIDRTGLTLVFPGDPDVDYLDPVECRAFFLPVGRDAPRTLAEWLESGLGCSLHTEAVPQGPDSRLVVPLPTDLPKNHYLVQTVFGFPKEI